MKIVPLDTFTDEEILDLIECALQDLKSRTEAKWHGFQKLYEALRGVVVSQTLTAAAPAQACAAVAAPTSAEQNGASTPKRRGRPPKAVKEYAAN